ncbi:MAG: sigma-70 family RNA polymerase sigma factor [Prevotella sp.]
MKQNANSTFIEMYTEFYGEVKKFFTRYTHDESRAEDMAQDLFLRLFDYKDMIVHATARSFVFTTAKRMIIDDARRAAFVRRATADLTHKAQDELFWNDCETFECKQIREMEQAKLNTMPKKMAMIYRLTRFEGKTADELAEELHISKRTVEYHLYVSRREVRNALKSALG